jgi:hypothetical protein
MGVVCVSSDELIEEGKRAIRQDRSRWFASRHKSDRSTEIEIVDRSLHVWFVPGGMAMGLEDGPSEDPLTLSRRTTVLPCYHCFYAFRVGRRYYLATIAPSEVFSSWLNTHFNSPIKHLTRRAPAILRPVIPDHQELAKSGGVNYE